MWQQNLCKQWCWNCPRRYCMSLYVKGLQSYIPLNCEDDQITMDLNPSCGHNVWLWPRSRIFFIPPNFTACNSKAEALLGISFRSVNQIFTNRRYLNWGSAVLISKIIGVSIDTRVIQNKQKLQDSKKVKFLVRFRINKKKKPGKMQRKVRFSNSKTDLAHCKVLAINATKQTLIWHI